MNIVAPAKKAPAIPYSDLFRYLLFRYFDLSCILFVILTVRKYRDSPGCVTADCPEKRKSLSLPEIQSLCKEASLPAVGEKIREERKDIPHIPSLLSHFKRGRKRKGRNIRICV